MRITRWCRDERSTLLAGACLAMMAVITAGLLVLIAVTLWHPGIWADS